MNKLLKILGQEKFDELKALMGDKFEEFATLFEKDEIIIDSDGEYIKKSDVSEPVKVLDEGWLKEDGSVDMEKVVDASLKGYIEGLNQKIADGEKKVTEALINNAISAEAEKAGVISVEDILKFIELSTIKVEEGKVEGVAEAIATLKKDKPYLFKQDGDNSGFNPSKPKKSEGYVQGMSFADAWDAAEN
jgi:hypothetical protein